MTDNNEKNKNIEEIKLIVKNENIPTNSSVAKCGVKFSTEKKESIQIEDISENKFLTDLHKMMSNSEFRQFYDDYFHDFVDVKVAVLYMKLYEKLQIEYKKRNNCDIESTLLLYIIREVMNDNVSRKKVFENYEHFIKNNDPHFLDIFFEKKIKN